MQDIQTPLSEELARSLKCGESVTITGVVYTARDAAHKRLAELAEKGGEFPFPIRDSIIYYVGPTPAREGQAIGSAGPTSSYRMDAYSPALLELGNRGMIGKGERGPEVIKAMRRNGGVYFGVIGGAGALLSKCVKSAKVIAYEDLGAEAIRRLEVERLPAVVVIDSEGNNLYKIGRDAYLKFKREQNRSALKDRPASEHSLR